MLISTSGGTVEQPRRRGDDPAMLNVIGVGAGTAPQARGRPVVRLRAAG